ncbi:MAG: acetyl-CoA carboxylase, carboxyltransferase subunit beta [Verrucomicrobiae bacterium]|jgi:acetyl-CoA carboxylase carboxyl transferase subunit beta|nr:acetyl-CoA carboxylase, carboxyltransferase subunit beta [Verrucomicrobiae bacterium]
MDTTSFIKKTIGGVTHVEPALTPPPIQLTPTQFPVKPKQLTTKPRTKKRDIPEGLWMKCPTCGTMIFDKELDENLKVCPKCQHHFPIGSRERIHSLVETCSFEEMDAEMSSVDILRFAGYRGKLERDRKNTMLTDAVVTGIGKIGSHRLALGVMDFGFMGGSMGSVVGEKLTRLIERATEGGLPVVIIATSGGARMQEGVFSLMQMAKTSGALAYHAQQRLPFISVLTNNSYGGVMASFAALGDLILAEPAALIGFAGPRVIKDTTHAELPPGFQTAEFLLERGLIDATVPRKEMKEQLMRYLDYFAAGKKHA